MRSNFQAKNLKGVRPYRFDRISFKHRLSWAVDVYLCHRFSGVKLQDIGDLYGISQSGVTQAGRQFEDAPEKGRSLEKRVLEIARELAFTNGHF